MAKFSVSVRITDEAGNPMAPAIGTFFRVMAMRPNLRGWRVLNFRVTRNG